MNNKATIKLTDDDLALINGGNVLSVRADNGTEFVLIPPASYNLINSNHVSMLKAGKNDPGNNEGVFSPK